MNNQINLVSCRIFIDTYDDEKLISSIQKVWDRADQSGNLPIRISALTLLGTIHLKYERPEEYLPTIGQAESLARQYGSVNLIIESLNKQAGYFINSSNDYTEASIVMSEINRLTKEYGLTSYRVQYLLNHGRIYWKQGDLSESMNYLMDCIKEHQDNQIPISSITKERLTSAVYGVGYEFTKNGHYVEAMRCYARILRPDIRFSSGWTTSILNSIGCLYGYYQKKHWYALRYFLLALTHDPKTQAERTKGIKENIARTKRLISDAPQKFE